MKIWGTVPQMFGEVSFCIDMIKVTAPCRKGEKKSENVRIQHPLWGVTFAELDAGKGRETAALRANLK